MISLIFILFMRFLLTTPFLQMQRNMLWNYEKDEESIPVGTLQFLAILKGRGESEDCTQWWRKLYEGGEMRMKALVFLTLW